TSSSWSGGGSSPSPQSALSRQALIAATNAVAQSWQVPPPLRQSLAAPTASFRQVRPQRGGPSGGDGRSQPAAVRHSFSFALTSARHAATSPPASLHALSASRAAVRHSSPQMGGRTGVSQLAAALQALRASANALAHSRKSPPPSWHSVAAFTAT